MSAPTKRLCRLNVRRATQEAGILVPDGDHSIRVSGGNVSGGAPLFYVRTFTWLAESGVAP